MSSEIAKKIYLDQLIQIHQDLSQRYEQIEASVNAVPESRRDAVLEELAQLQDALNTLRLRIRRYRITTEPYNNVVRSIFDDLITGVRKKSDSVRSTISSHT